VPSSRSIRVAQSERAACLELDSRDEGGGRAGVCTRIGQQLGIPSDSCGVGCNAPRLAKGCSRAPRRADRGVGAREARVAAGQCDLEECVGFLRAVSCHSCPLTRRSPIFISTRNSSGRADLQATGDRPSDLLGGQVVVSTASSKPSVWRRARAPNWASASAWVQPRARSWTRSPAPSRIRARARTRPSASWAN
jgi:hypothetical protein